MKRPALSDMSVGSPSDRETEHSARQLQGSKQAILLSSNLDSSTPISTAAEKARPPSWEKAQVIVRMPKEKRRRLHELALGLDKTVQDVFTEALDEYVKKRGLRSLD